MASKTILPPAPAVRASDDEILGLTPNTIRKTGRAATAKTAGERPSSTPSQAEVDAFFSELGSADTQRADEQVAGPGAAEETGAATQDSRDGGVSEKLNEVMDANPELRDAWHDAKAYREVFATPAEAQAATKLLGDLNRMDALFFSKRPEDHAELARAVSQLDPHSFASLARAMTELTNGAATRTNGGEIPSSHQAAPAQHNSGRVEVARTTEARAASPAAVAGLTAAQAEFFQGTNAAAVQSVMDSIEAQVDRLLPEGISKSARNRVAGEIYRELDSTLQGNRALGQQMRDAFRSGGLDEAHRKAIVSLVTGRARQALPGVAKRVLNEWTNTIVSANQDRRTRQRAAERRVDISGSGGGNDGRRAISARDIDYGRMSDGDILNL
jgi:hypothetical protein